MNANKYPMKKVHTDGVTVPTPEEIAYVERRIGYKLPKAYLDVICNPDAEFVKSGLFDVMDGTQEDVLRSFYPIDHILGSKLSMHGDDIPPYIIPIAYGGSDNRICIVVDEARPDYGAIYYHDIERCSGVEDSDFVKISNSLPEFLGSLIPAQIVYPPSKFSPA